MLKFLTPFLRVTLWAMLLLALTGACTRTGLSPLGAKGEGQPPCNTPLCPVPIKTHHLKSGRSLTLQTNSGSPMLLQIQNESAVNTLQFSAACGGFSIKSTLGVYAPDNLMRYNRQWGGCRLTVVNLTPKSVPATALVLLVGQ